MKTRRILVCSDENHAEVVDAIVMAHLTDAGHRANAWSEVWSDGERFGIIWEEPVASLFGTPDIDPSLIVVENTARAWAVVPAPEPEAPNEGAV